jgi:hypothetical protein
MRCAKATLLFAVGVPLLLVYRDHSSMAGSAWGVVISGLGPSSLWSSCDGPTGDELRARFMGLRRMGVVVGCEPRQNSCSSGEATGLAVCRDESSTFPTRSASGSLVAGVDGGGKVLFCDSLGVSNGASMSFVTLFAFGVSLALSGLSDATGRFSLSMVDSAPGAPSMNWKALSLVRVWVEGMMGGPVTTCRAGGAL